MFKVETSGLPYLEPAASQSVQLPSKLSEITILPLPPKIEGLAWKKNNAITKFLFFIETEHLDL